VPPQQVVDVGDDEDDESVVDAEEDKLVDVGDDVEFAVDVVRLQVDN